MQTPDKPWDWQWLSDNPNITMDIINANPDKPWDWQWLSKNPNITMDVINANPDKPWDWKWLSDNKFANEKKIFELNVRYQKFVQELLGMGYTIDELDNVL